MFHSAAYANGLFSFNMIWEKHKIEMYASEKWKYAGELSTTGY